MSTVAYVGFCVSFREYHIPCVERRPDVKVKSLSRCQGDIAQSADNEPLCLRIPSATNFALKSHPDDFKTNGWDNHLRMSCNLRVHINGKKNIAGRRMISRASVTEAAKSWTR
ncbi:MAG: hypothetical protein K6E38_07170 [Fretibacterium sp.]|nr:hypothetical protein [Fretibacterium sp.]